MTTDPYSLVESAVQQHAAAVRTLIEYACEAALQTGDRGVLVVTDDDSWTMDADGTMHAGATMHAGPCELVPYGQIHYVPRAALSEWLERQLP